MKFPSPFINNNSARMPLTILGIIMVIMTIAFTTHIDKMDREMAESLNSENTVNTVDNAYMYACADLARIINYAGMAAMKEMGETPVIVIEPTSEYNLSTNGNCNISDFNLNRAKGMIRYVMNRFIQTNYMYNSFDYRDVAVNVEPLTDWKEINIIPIYMGLDREIKPGLGNNTIDELMPDETYVTYWRVQVPVNLSIVDLETDEILYHEDMVLGNLITCRYPLLEQITYEYEDRLTSTGPLMMETTALAQGFTMGRGYFQYLFPGGPDNIISNELLAFIVNGALMVDQGFVFNSVDSNSILEYVMESKRLIYDEKDVDMGQVYMGIELNNDSFEIDPQADAAHSTGDFENATAALEEGLHFDYNATPIMEFMNNDSLVGGSKVNNMIRSIIPQVYSASLATGVTRDTTLEPGEHDGYEENYNIAEWGEPDSMEQIDTLVRDEYVPGNLYGEVWRVIWSREHVWRHAYEVEYACMKPAPAPVNFYWDTCYRTEYDYMTTIDVRVDIVNISLEAKENSFAFVHLDHVGFDLSTMNDVNDAFTSRGVEYNNYFVDPNLEEAYLQYKNEVYDQNKLVYIKDMGLNGVVELRSYSPDPPEWLYDEVRLIVDDITQQIRNDVHLDREINNKNYPLPGEIMNATAVDLTAKIKANQTRYVDKGAYFDGGRYLSASGKVISLVREWYVDEVLYQVDKQYGGAGRKIEEEIDNEFGGIGDVVREAQQISAKLLGGLMRFPLGVTMVAEHVMENGTHYEKDEMAYWDENVTLMVDMEPDFLRHDVFYDPDKDEWIDAVMGVDGKYVADPKLNPSPRVFIPLALQNINAFAEASTLRNGGLPVLPPTPSTAWILTTNFWTIRVKGTIDELMIIDADNECHPNPMFGHEAQVYSRKLDREIYDPATDSFIGDNMPMTFEFTTGTLIFVPAGLKGVGDKRGEGTNEKSIGAINEGWI
ncbi:MAG: hypothetical protein K8R25_16405 [Methanosarcinales archaeon]|nr:hypothetical protein [Methanosarcinales archaeon]